MADLMKQEAISTLPVRLIDANALLRPDYNSNRVLIVGGARQNGKTLAMAMALVKRKIETAPTIDAAPVVHGWWEWFEEWNPSTPEHPKECEDCGWRCGRCKTALEDIVGGYWDNPEEKPKLTYCPDCGAKMDLEG